MKVNWADKIDMATGRPVESEVFKRIRAGSDEEVFPSVLGGKNWEPMSWNPTTGLAYANTLNISWPYQLVKPEYKQGEWFLGINFRGVNLPKSEPHGYLSTLDPMTGKAKARGRPRESINPARVFNALRAKVHKDAIGAQRGDLPDDGALCLDRTVVTSSHPGAAVGTRTRGPL